MIYLLAAIAAWFALDALIVLLLHWHTRDRSAPQEKHRVRGLGVDMAQCRREHEADDQTGCAWRG